MCCTRGNQGNPRDQVTWWSSLIQVSSGPLTPPLSIVNLSPSQKRERHIDLKSLVSSCYDWFTTYSLFLLAVTSLQDLLLFAVCIVTLFNLSPSTLLLFVTLIVHGSDTQVVMLFTFRVLARLGMKCSSGGVMRLKSNFRLMVLAVNWTLINYVI